MSMLPDKSLYDNEEIEGLGDDEVASWNDNYPIDTVLIRTESRTVYDVIRRINNGQFIMDPDFQRDFIWSETKQSKLIESVLMRIPLPVFYLAENQDGKIIVVDGLQRLTTFHRFARNELRLNLPDHEELHGKYFKELSAKFQNRVEDCNLILYIVDSKAPTQVQLDIFDRVNSGVPLTRQQMRNCLFAGKATQFLKEEAGKPLFKDVTRNSLNPKVMRDREFINRFCAFRVLGHEQYTSNMDDFLSEALRQMNMNTFSPEEYTKLSAEFETSLKNNWMLFERHAFRKHTRGQDRRNIINASLWDVMITRLSHYSENTVSAHAHALRTAFYSLLEDEAFRDSITLGTSQPDRVRTRFSLATRMFKEVLGDYSN